MAIGQAIQKGAVLYRDIWDNKTPLLYLIYALSPTVIWAKVSATLFVLGTCITTFFLSKKIFSNKYAFLSLITTALTGTFLSLPVLEGTIANAELYFTLPIVLCAYLLFTILTDRDWLTAPIVTGLLMSFAFLIKVPAIFDFLGIFIAFSVIRESNIHQSFVNNAGKFLLNSIKFYLPTLISFMIPLVLFVGYFYYHNALLDFITASFSQNASYIAIDSGPLSRLSNPLFIKAALLVWSYLLLTLLYWKKHIGKEVLFLSMWLGASLYGALLSNRPYLHYLLQIVPPAVILFVYLLANIRKYSYLLTIFLFLGFGLVRMFTGAFALDTVSYYQNFIDYVGGNKNWEDYVNYFDSHTSNNYFVGNFLNNMTDSKDSIFFWGDNAFVYVLSNRKPAAKFIQAHHLTTIDQRQYDAVLEKLANEKPKYILISEPMRFPFPALSILVETKYRPNGIFGDIHAYRLLN